MTEAQVLDAEATGERDDDIVTSAPDMSTRQLPWAGISTAVVPDGESLTSQQMLAQAGLDWEVGIRPYSRLTGTRQVVTGGEWVEVDGVRHLVGGRVEEVPVYANSSQAFETYRMDTDAELGMVRKKYVPVQNRAAFDFGDSLVADGRGKWTHAGPQQNGKKLFMTMLLADEFTVLGGNPFKVYLFLSAAHDGTRSLKGFVTPINAFCTNQTRAIIASNVGEFTIQHTSGAEGKMADAAVAIGQAGEYSTLVKAQAEQLAALRITDDKARYTLLSVIPERRPRRNEMVNGIMNLFATSPTVADYRNTGWGLLNSLTEYMDHCKRQNNANARYESITFGEGAKTRLAIASALAEMN